MDYQYQGANNKFYLLILLSILVYRVDTPTERRVRRWAISFRELLSDVTGKHEFEKFLQKEYSQENIRFWSACETLKYAPQSMVPEMVHEIYR